MPPVRSLSVTSVIVRVPEMPNDDIGTDTLVHAGGSVRPSTEATGTRPITVEPLCTWRPTVCPPVDPP